MLVRPGDGRWDEENGSKKIENKSKGLLQECRDSYYCSVTMFHESSQQWGCSVQILSLFLGRSQAEGKHNKEKVHALVFAESIYIHCPLLLGLPIMMACLTGEQQSCAGLWTLERPGSPHKPNHIFRVVQNVTSFETFHLFSLFLTPL